MSLPKTIYEAQRAVMTTESRLANLSDEVKALSQEVKANTLHLSTIVQGHAERLAHLEGKFELVETSLSSRRKRLPG